MNKNGRYQISVVEFNTMLMIRLDILGEIQRLIYAHDDTEKFIYNEYTKKTQISPYWMNKTNQFNALKRMIHRTSNQDTMMIDVTLLNSFME